MEFLSFRGVAFKLIIIFLWNRKQFVLFDKCNSDVPNISYDVSQDNQTTGCIYYISINESNIMFMFPRQT